MSAEPTIEARLAAAWKERAGAVMNGRLHESRETAFERFSTEGLPPARSESWKYTPIRRILEALPPLDLDAAESAASRSVSDADVSTLGIAGLQALRLVLVDGRLRRDLSDLDRLPSGIRVLDLRESGADPAVLAHLDQSGETNRDVFADLNSAFVGDGILIEVGEGIVLDEPLLIQHVVTAAQPALIQPRIIGVFGPGAVARLVETSGTLGNAPVLINAVSEYFTGRGASIDHIRISDEHAEAVHINNLRSYQEGSSTFSTHVVTLSRGTVRNQAYYLPDGEHCETNLSGFYLARDGSHIDNHTFVDHAKPECESNELFKGILSGKSVGVFNGKVLVRQDAQKINAYQSNKSVLLGGAARVYSKPELEIYADDVRCSHGATTGELDKEAMFYLQARGIRPDDARLILLEAFAGDVLDRIALEPVRDHVSALVRDRLAG